MMRANGLVKKIVMGRQIFNFSKINGSELDLLGA